MLEIVDSQGRVWTASLINQGRASGYLNPKVHRPIVQFSCQDLTVPRRYAALPLEADALTALPVEALAHLFERSRTH